MTRRGWVAALLAVLLIGCLPLRGAGTSSSTPTPAPKSTWTPQPTLTPTPQFVPTPAGLDITDAGILYTSPRYGYAVFLPTGWRAIVPPAQVDEVFDALEAADETLELVALLPASDGAGASQAQLTVMALPRGSLLLGDYLEQTVKMLSLVAATHIERAALDPTLRRDGLPAAVIEYTAKLEADDPLAGYQATFVGADSTTLVVLTFTTRVEQYATLRPQFIQIARRVDLAPSSPTR